MGLGEGGRGVGGVRVRSGVFLHGVHSNVSAAKDIVSVSQLRR